MNKKQFTLIVVFTIIFAFLGGALSTQLFLGNPVFAGPPPKIEAQEFCLVDNEGKPRAVLKTANNDLITILELMDRKGQRRVMIMVDGNGNPSAHFWDRNAELSYKPINAPSILFWEGNARLRARLPYEEMDR